MTRDSDTDEYDDGYEIDINKRNQIVEEGVSALLANEYFLLLYVPDNGDKMQIIRPATSLYHRSRMTKKINEATGIPSFYFALSHLWGLTANNRYRWDEIGEYVDDENGEPVKPVSMRHEKRDTLLALLKDHPDSYWWIDVLCARSDTPLDIMGDIYACCLECFSMVDCEPSLIPKIHAMSDANKELMELSHIIWSKEQRFPTSKEVYETKAPQAIEPLYTFFQNQWWKRVWTWQEMALPVGCVRFMAETDIHRLQRNTITRDELLDFAPLVGQLTNYV